MQYIFTPRKNNRKEYVKNPSMPVFIYVLSDLKNNLINLQKTLVNYKRL